jgi:hypothetical protein
MNKTKKRIEKAFFNESESNFLESPKNESGFSKAEGKILSNLTKQYYITYF